MRRSFSRATVVVLALAGAVSTLPAQQPAPDVILSNGKIITVDERFTVAQAIAVRGDRIVAVGSDAEVLKLATPARAGSTFVGARSSLDSSTTTCTCSAPGRRGSGRCDGTASAREPSRSRSCAHAPSRLHPANGSTTSAGGQSSSSPTTRVRSRARNWIRSSPTIQCFCKPPITRPISIAARSSSSRLTTSRPNGLFAMPKVSPPAESRRRASAVWSADSPPLRRQKSRRARWP